MRRRGFAIVAPLLALGADSAGWDEYMPVSDLCCVVCYSPTSKACGSACIRKEYTCRKPRGCACDPDDERLK